MFFSSRNGRADASALPPLFWCSSSRRRLVSSEGTGCPASAGSILALHLIAEGQKAKALKVLQKAEKELPTYNIPMNYMSGGNDIARAYAMLGQKKKALEVINQVWKNASQYEQYYLSEEGVWFQGSQRDCLMQLSIMTEMAKVTELVDPALARKQNSQIDAYYRMYVGKGGQQLGQ